MAYANVTDVQERMTRVMSESEQTICTTLLNDAAVIIDTFAPNADAEAKAIVSCRMVMRAMGDGDTSSGFPMGTSQGSQSALGYSASFTLGSGYGGVGELYLGRLEKMLLGIIGNKIGSRSPVEDMGRGFCQERWWHDVID